MTDALLRLAREVDDLGHRLTQVGVELHALSAASPLSTAGEPAPTDPSPAADAPPHPTPFPQPPPPFPQTAGLPPFPQTAAQSPTPPSAFPPPFPHTAFPPAWPQQAGPGVPPPHTGQPPFPQAGPTPFPYGAPLPPPQPKRTLGEMLAKEGAGSRLLAWVGGAITLLGVVLLLVLAVQRGWLGPLPRVLIGAAFGAGLIGVGLRLHRTPAARTGAFALAGTGLAVLYLASVAATALYEFLPVPAGLAAGLAVAAGGLWLAKRWDSEVLATAVVLGCAVCAPVITDGPNPALVTFLLILTVAVAPLPWPVAALAGRVPPVVASVASSAIGPASWQNTAAAVATTVIVAGLALRVREDVTAQASLGVAVVPVLAASAALPNAQGGLVTALAAVAFVAVWVLARQPVAGIAGMVAAVQSTATFLDGAAMTAVLLAEGLLLAAVAWRTRDRTALAGGAAFGVLGVMRALPMDIPPGMLLEFGGAPRPGALLVAALLLAVAVVVPWAAARAEAIPPPAKSIAPWLVAGGAALYGGAALVLGATLLAMPDRAGFLTGHVLVTVSWTAAALVLLAKGIDSVPLRASGLALVGAAVGKLILFDLSALDGIARVAVFIAAGLILLVAGTRYARLVATR